ncbi:GSCOCT00013420001.3-RA-CDS, partial [Cotesia congregata]
MFLKIVYFFFKLIGLAPFAVKEYQSSIRVHYSKNGNLYNCLLIIFGLYLSFLTYKKYLNSEFPIRSDLSQEFLLVKALLGLISLISFWTAICLKQESAVRIFYKLIEVDKLTSEELKQVTYNSTKKLLTIYCSINLFLWISIMIIDMLAFNSLFNSTWLITSLPRFIESCWFIIQYGLIANLLKKRFSYLNSSFETFANNIAPFNEVKMINEFLQLTNLYSLLYEIVQEISEFYSFPIFLITTYFCGSIVYTSYYLLQPFVYYTEEYTFLLTCNSIQYLCMELFPIVILTINITALTNEVPIDILNIIKFFLGNYNLVIKRFSITLLTRNNQFTAYNFFPINCTLLHTIISTTATYLVILFQFQHDSKEDD